MGVIAEGIAAFIQPLIDQTDCSPEQLQKAVSLGNFCFNLALLPDDEQQAMLHNVQQDLGLNYHEFNELRQSVIEPMIRRHQEMFPLMHRRPSTCQVFDEQLGAKAVEKYPGTDRYAPCPCNSGKKYKFCCGKRGS